MKPSHLFSSQRLLRPLLRIGQTGPHLPGTDTACTSTFCVTSNPSLFLPCVCPQYLLGGRSPDEISSRSQHQPGSTLRGFLSLISTDQPSQVNGLQTYKTSQPQNCPSLAVAPRDKTLHSTRDRPNTPSGKAARRAIGRALAWWLTQTPSFPPRGCIGEWGNGRAGDPLS